MPRPNVSEQRKREIIQAGAMVFTSHGLSSARMEDVAAAAGISKGTVYLYFPSKDNLIEALLHTLFQPLDESLARLIASEEPIRDRLLAFAEETLASSEGARPLHPLILDLFALARHQPFAESVFTTYFLRYRESLRSLLSTAHDRGEISLRAFEDEPQRAALAFMAALEGALLLSLLIPTILDLQSDGGSVMRAWISQL